MSSTDFESIFSGFESFVLEISKISGKCNSFTSLAIFSNIWKHNYFSKSIIFFKRQKDLYGDLISSNLMVRNYDIVRFLQTLGILVYWTADSRKYLRRTKRLIWWVNIVKIDGVRIYDIVRFLQTLGFFKYWTADSKNISSAVIINVFFWLEIDWQTEQN